MVTCRNLLPSWRVSGGRFKNNYRLKLALFSESLAGSGEIPDTQLIIVALEAFHM